MTTADIRHLSKAERSRIRRGHIDRLISMIEAAARAGQICPSVRDLSPILGLSEGYITTLLVELREAGALRIELTPDRQRIVEAPDGSWRTADPPPLNGSPSRRPAPPPRPPVIDLGARAEIEEAARAAERFRVVISTPIHYGACGCRWPMGDPAGPAFRYCDAPRPRGDRPYCAEHLARAYEPPAPRGARQQ
jgi:hypothetical protein